MSTTYIDSGLGWVADERFFKSDAGNLCTISGRTFYTYQRGAIVYATVYNGSYTGPVVISTIRDIVAYEPGSVVSQGSFKYLGLTWYITSFTYWMSGNYSDTSGLSQKLVITGTSSFSEVGIKVLKEAGVIPSDYNKTSTTKVYYNGSSKVIKRLCQIINSVAKLGTTHTTAFYGDLGQEAYDHSQAKGNPHNLTLADLGIENIQRQIELLMDTVGSLDTWRCHDGDDEFIDHEGNVIVFVSGSDLLKLH